MMDIDQLLAAKLTRIHNAHRVDQGKPALIVVDMQHGFLDEGASLEVAKGRAIVPNIARLIDACRAKGVPVIFTEFVYADAVPCLRGDPFGQEHLAVKPGAWTLHRLYRDVDKTLMHATKRAELRSAMDI